MTGRILQIFPTQSITSKTTGKIFTKREIVLDCTRYDAITGERGYENTPVFEFTGERCSMLDTFQIGQIVTISFDVQGSKSTQGDRYFNSVRGFKIELKQIPQSANPQPQGYLQSQTYQNAPQQGIGGGYNYPPQQFNGGIKEDAPF